jgi:hypothetical protein
LLQHTLTIPLVPIKAIHMGIFFQDTEKEIPSDLPFNKELKLTHDMLTTRFTIGIFLDVQ